MNKSTWIIIGLVLVAFMGVFGATMMNKGNGIDYSKYDEKLEIPREIVGEAKTKTQGTINGTDFKV